METPSSIQLAWSLRDRNAPVIAGIVYHLQKGEVMYEEGSAAEGVFQVITGAIRLCRVVGPKKQVIFDLVLPGEHFGVESLLGEKTDYQAIAQVATTVVRIGLRLPREKKTSKRRLPKKKKTSKRMSREVWAAMLTALQIAVEARRRRERSIRTLVLTGDLIKQVTFLASWCPDDVLKSIGSEMLADFHGCSREMISRVRGAHPKLSKKFRTTKAHLRKAA
ncbi:MAG TPA: cyclic nucleotide-binding domain-containing protein [Candidatus Paceibacterota bacterium]